MLTEKTILLQLAADVVNIQALMGMDWHEELHPRASDGRFGSKAGAEATSDSVGEAVADAGEAAKGAASDATAAIGKFMSGLSGGVAQQAQAQVNKLQGKPDPPAEAQNLLDFAKRNPGKVAAAGIVAAAVILGLHPRAVRDLLKGAKGEAKVGQKAAKGVAKGEVDAAKAEGKIQDIGKGKKEKGERGLKAVKDLPEGMQKLTEGTTAQYSASFGEHKVVITAHQNAKGAREINFYVNDKLDAIDTLSDEDKFAASMKVRAAMAYDMGQHEGHTYSAAAYSHDSAVVERTLGYAKMGYGKPVLGVPGMPQYGKVVNGSLVPDVEAVRREIAQINEDPRKLEEYNDKARYIIRRIIGSGALNEQEVGPLAYAMQKLTDNDEVRVIEKSGDVIMQSLETIRKKQQEARKAMKKAAQEAAKANVQQAVPLAAAKGKTKPATVDDVLALMSDNSLSEADLQAQLEGVDPDIRQAAIDEYLDMFAH